MRTSRQESQAISQRNTINTYCFRKIKVVIRASEAGMSESVLQVRFGCHCRPKGLSCVLQGVEQFALSLSASYHKHLLNNCAISMYPDNPQVTPEVQTVPLTIIGLERKCQQSQLDKSTCVLLYMIPTKFSFRHGGNRVVIFKVYVLKAGWWCTWLREHITICKDLGSSPYSPPALKYATSV